MSALPNWSFVHGSSWLTPDGEILQVPGFHEAWITEHDYLVPGCSNVCDVILSKNWIAVGVYAGKYVELLIPGRKDAGILERAWHFLSVNSFSWSTALVLTMDEEGYVKITPDDISSRERFMECFAVEPAVK